MKSKNRIILIVLFGLVFVCCSHFPVEESNLGCQVSFADSVPLVDIAGKFIFNTKIEIIFCFQYDTIPNNITVGRTPNSSPYFKIRGEYHVKDTSGFGTDFGHYYMVYSHNGDTANVTLLWNNVSKMAQSELGVSVLFYELGLFLPDNFFVNANRIHFISAVP
jgi:hypothetical protein